MASKHSTGSKSSSDAIAVLKDDHERVKQLIKEFQKRDKGGHDGVEEIAKQICDELEVHSTIEEEIFYPGVRDAIGDDEIVDEAEVEHDLTDNLIKQIGSGDSSQERYTAKMRVLGELVMQHIKEEEKNIFPKLKKSAMDLDELGQRILSRKQELRSEMGLGER